MTRNTLYEGDITAADTFTALTTRGSETSPTRQIPTAWKKITRIIAAVAADMTAAGSAIFILRLTGNAIQGSQDIVIAGNGGQDPQAGADTSGIIGLNFLLDNADIDIKGGDNLDIQAAMTDTDLGTARVVVSLYGE